MMRFAWPIVWLLAFIAGYLVALDAQEEAERFSTLARVRHQETYDTKGIQFFAIVTPEGEGLLSVDGDLQIAQWLLSQKNQKIRLTLERAELKQVER